MKKSTIESIAVVVMVVIAYVIGIYMGHNDTTPNKVSGISWITSKDSVVVIGDEIPGMGATIDNPDTCKAYVDQETRFIVITRIKP